MNAKLFFQAILKFLAGIILVGLLVFLPAGTINFFQRLAFNGRAVCAYAHSRNCYDV